MVDCIDQAEMKSNIETPESSEWPTLMVNHRNSRSGRRLTQYSMRVQIGLTCNALFQYWVICQPDLHTHPLGIALRVDDSDYTSVSILDGM